MANITGSPFGPASKFSGGTTTTPASSANNAGTSAPAVSAPATSTPATSTPAVTSAPAKFTPAPDRGDPLIQPASNAGRATPAAKVPSKPVPDPEGVDPLNFTDDIAANDDGGDNGAPAKADDAPTTFDFPDVDGEGSDANEDKDKESFTAKPDDEPSRTDKPNGGRDYSQFDPEVAAILKKLPNAQYAAVKDKLQEWKEGANKAAELEKKFAEYKTANPPYLAEHPMSYRLDNNFQTAVALSKQHKEERAFWEQQLINIEQGEEWEDFQGYNEQGEPIIVKMSAPANGQVDVRARVRAQSAYANAERQMADQTDRARSIKANWQEHQKTATATLKEQANKLFNGMSGDKLKGKDKELYNNVMNMFLGPYAGHLLTEYVALAFVSQYKNAQLWQKKFDELKGKTKVAPAVGPRNSAPGNLPGSSTVIDLSKLLD